MDKSFIDFIEQQKTLAQQYLEGLGTEKAKEKKAASIVVGYLSSLLNPENYTDAQKEDLRKLALELSYQEDTDFNKWVENIPFPEEKSSE